MTQRASDHEDCREYWKGRLQAAFANPCASAEGANGRTPLDDLAAEVLALGEVTWRIVGQSLIDLLHDQTRQNEDYWDNLRVFAADAFLPAAEGVIELQKMLRSKKNDDVVRRAAALGVLTNTGALLTPRLMESVDDLRSAAPQIWLSAAGTIGESQWLRNLFEQTVPDLLRTGAVSGIDVALRLGVWAKRNQSLLTDAVRSWLRRDDIAESEKEPIRDWMKRQGYSTVLATMHHHQPERTYSTLAPLDRTFLVEASSRKQRICVPA